MCACTARDAQKALSKKQNISGNGKKQREEEDRRESKKRKREKRKKEGEKNGVQGGAPLCTADTNFPKERIKRLAMKGKTKRKGRKNGDQENAHSQSCK